MANSDFDSLKSNVMEWLVEGEELFTFTLGSLENSTFNTIIALTSKYLRLGTVSGGQNIAHINIKLIKYSALWARLNINTINPRQRFVFSINGKKWKQQSDQLAQKWIEISNRK
jgi:hypothetical protein